MLESIDQAAFVTYLVALVVVGLLTAKRIISSEEFIVAGRRLKLWLAFSTVAATWIGGGITIGIAGKAYAGKAIGVWGTTIGFGTTLILVGLFFAGPLHRMRLYTLADFYSTRFGKAWLGAVSALIMFVAYVFAVTAQIVAGSKLIHVVFGWDYTLAAVVTGSIIVFYTVLGGLWAVSLTDFLQLLITFTGVSAALVIALAKAGVSNVAAEIGGLGLLDPKVFLTIDFWALMLVLALGDVPAPDLAQRIFASKDEATAKRSALLAGVSYYVIGVVSMLVGVSALILLPGLGDAELAYPALIKEVLPAGIAGIVLSGLMAAVMSNADSMLLAPATVLAKNLGKDVLRPGMSDSTLLFLTRSLVVVLGIGAIAAAVARADIIYWLTLAFDILFASLFVPLALGIWWRGYTWVGAAAGIFAGAAARVLLEYALNAGIVSEWWIPSLAAPAISLLASLLANSLGKG